MDLIDHLRTIIRHQYLELRRSLCGLRDFRLAAAFMSRHTITQMRWNSMTDEAKERAFVKLMKDDGTRVDKKTVTSTDGALTVVGSPKIARKKVNDVDQPQNAHPSRRCKYLYFSVFVLFFVVVFLFFHFMWHCIIFFSCNIFIFDASSLFFHVL